MTNNDTPLCSRSKTGITRSDVALVFGARGYVGSALVSLEPMGFERSVAATLAAERRPGIANRWIEGAFAMRKHRIDYAYYAKRASGSTNTVASPNAVWKVLSTIGGSNRYFYLNGLWTLREWIDAMIGGPGLERGRRDPYSLEAGDKVDYWEVLGVESSRRLTLGFGMKAPGAGVLEFELEPLQPTGTRLTATGYWHPAGFRGLLYWYALEPVHRVIFDGMTREICRRAASIVDDSAHAG